MQNFRITKYDPDRRGSDGSFPKDDWTSIFDIGRRFAGVTLTLSSYRRAERLYVRAFIDAVRTVKPGILILSEVEVQSDLRVPAEVKEESQRLLESIPQGGGEVSPLVAARFVKASLREIVWGKIGDRDGFYTHFGYDYYMYIGDRLDRLGKFQARGLFTETFASPYRDGAT